MIDTRSLWDHACTQKTCEQWFQRFRNDDFHVKVKERPGQPKNLEDADLLALIYLLENDATQNLKKFEDTMNFTQWTIRELLHALAKFQKEGQ